MENTDYSHIYHMHFNSYIENFEEMKARIFKLSDERIDDCALEIFELSCLLIRDFTSANHIGEVSVKLHFVNQISQHLPKLFTCEFMSKINSMVYLIFTIRAIYKTIDGDKNYHNSITKIKDANLDY